MVVHLGVILVAVALVTSSAYTELTELRLRTGEEVAWGGHTFELVDVVSERDDRTEVVRANVRLDGGQAYGPAITTFLQMGQPIGTPSVRTGLTHDVYLTIAGTNTPTVGGDEATIEVFKKPLILWMWIGGLLMAVGTVLAAFPGRRRRDPLAPVSARVPVEERSSSDDDETTSAGVDAPDTGADEPVRPEVVAGD
jgi:cytochrome c-type biogenesis protein CcmF